MFSRYLLKLILYFKMNETIRSNIIHKPLYIVKEKLDTYGSEFTTLLYTEKEFNRFMRKRSRNLQAISKYDGGYIEYNIGSIKYMLFGMVNSYDTTDFSKLYSAYR